MKPIEGNVIADCYRSGMPLPSRIANAPELNFGMQLFLNAFYDLDSERSHSMGLTLIPRSCMIAYCKELQLDDEATDDLLFYVRQMDLINLEYLADKQKSLADKHRKQK